MKAKTRAKLRVFNEFLDAIFLLFLLFGGLVGLLLGSVGGHHYADSTMILFATMYLTGQLACISDILKRK